MQLFKRYTAVLLALALLFTCSCAGVFSADNSELKVGVDTIKGNFNPFFFDESDSLIMDQMFESVQRKGAANKLENVCGSITYEYLGDGRMKYTVSINDDVRFSDGSYATIDDILFYYGVLADATYNGTYSDWYSNGIEGILEYYYDDADYASALEDIEYEANEKYSLENIDLDDYAHYLEQTLIEGAFVAGEDVAPDGGTWNEYCSALGYGEEYAQLGKNPSDEKLLALIAQIEAKEHYSRYSPYEWWYEKLVDEYIESNYADGIDVEYISGISKTSNHSCTIIYNSIDINTISLINPVIIPKSVYGVGYVKGNAGAIELNEYTVGSGVYAYDEYDEEKNEITLTRNDFYYGDKAGFSNLRFVDLKGADKIKSVISGKVDVVETQATESIISDITDAELRYGLSDCNYYNSIIFNTEKVSMNVRRGLMSLANCVGEAKAQIGSYYTAVNRPLSLKFGEYPENSTVYFPYDAVAAAEFFAKDGYTKQGSVLADENGEPLVLDAVICADEQDALYAVLLGFKAALNSAGITMNITCVDEQAYNNSLRNSSADLWCGRVYDGDTSDKFSAYHSSSSSNYSRIKANSLDVLLENVRSEADYGTREALTEHMLDYVMLLAVELPLYQQKTVTVFNTKVIKSESVGYDAHPQGCRYILGTLQPE